MNVSIRKCTQEDLDILRDFSIRTFYNTFAHLNTAENMNKYLDEAFSEKRLRNELADTNSEFYFLYCEDNLAGYMKLNEAPSQTDINDKTSLEIERIYVSDEFQGAGFGRLLIEQAVTRAVKRSKKYVWLGVWENNEKAIRFYVKNGFYKIGNHSFVIGADIQTDYVMRKDLV